MDPGLADAWAAVARVRLGMEEKGRSGQQVTKYSLDIILSLLGTSLLFHVQL